MEQIANTYIAELCGYLKCLSRLSANNYVFGASAYEANCEIDDLITAVFEKLGKGDKYIESSECEYLGREIIEPQDIVSEIESYIFAGLLEREQMPNDKARIYATRMLSEDINEYYGLVSTSQNKDGEFHPLLSGEVYRLNIRNTKYSREFYFIKKIESLYVLTYFLQKEAHEA